MEISLRPMLPEDLANVSDLGIRSKASWGYSAGEMAVFEKELTHDASLIEQSVVAEVAVNEIGKIVGYFTLLKKEGSIELDYFFVTPEHFGLGIGRYMMEAAIDSARDAGAEKMSLISDPNAAAFYEKFGFKIVDQHQSSIPGRSIPIMEMEW